MRITTKQQNEIDWLCKHFGNGYIPTEEEKEIYIKNSVMGAKIREVSGGISPMGISKIEEFKRKLDIQIKMWRNDIANGLFAIWEFEEEMDGYGDKIFKSIMSNLPNNEREFAFLTPSILWANERWGLKLKLPNSAVEDYKDL